MKSILHVEVAQKRKSKMPQMTLHNYVLAVLEAEKILTTGMTSRSTSISKLCKESDLSDHVESIYICDHASNGESVSVRLEDFELLIHIFRLDEEGVQSESIEGGEGEGQEVSAAQHWLLPSRDFHRLWENLIFEPNIKENLLQCMETTLLFSDTNVCPNVITWNRIILLHGPPGTGKTSLCKALAHKLSIRLSKRYSCGQLLEVNSHSLFSKWFSESGKLVMRMFSKVRQLVENPSALVVVLIDEVESLTHARSSCSGVEPSDAIRTVNAVLTQLDSLKNYPNVLILATSNVTEAIDLAFVDRADIKQYIGPPPVKGIYKILTSCIEELMKANIIIPSEDIYSFDFLQGDSAPKTNSLYLLKIARDCEGLNGRTLRKLPYLAHALFIQRSSCSLECFLEALERVVAKQRMELKEIRGKCFGEAMET